MAKVTIHLKNPCPVCGNGQGLQIFGLGDDWWIKCPECHYTSEGGATLEEAVEDWNRGEVNGKID